MSRVLAELAAFYERHALTALTLLLSLTLVVVVVWPLSVVQIDSGYQGVMWRRFGGGTDMRTTFAEGTHLIFPWDVMYRYNIRTANLTVKLKVLFPDDLTADTRFTLIYRPIPEQLNLVHKYIGPDFENLYLRPLFIREINNAVKNFGDITKVPERRAEVESIIMANLVADLAARQTGKPDGIAFFVDHVIIGEIEVPAEVSSMIEQKNAERERGETYVYRIQNEMAEARRKRIEAMGIRDFQTILGNALTDNYLKLQGIEATRELARSANSKIVMFGNRAWGLPLMLDEQATPPQSAPPSIASRPPASGAAGAASPAPDATAPATPMEPPVGPPVEPPVVQHPAMEAR